jgi:hypothetical protein
MSLSTFFAAHYVAIGFILTFCIIMIYGRSKANTVSATRIFEHFLRKKDFDHTLIDQVARTPLPHFLLLHSYVLTFAGNLAFLYKSGTFCNGTCMSLKDLDMLLVKRGRGFGLVLLCGTDNVLLEEDERKHRENVYEGFADRVATMVAEEIENKKMKGMVKGEKGAEFGV